MVVQGSNGAELKIRIWEKGKAVNLDGATVTVKIKTGNRPVEKSAEIISNGYVNVNLTAEDIATAGIYYFRAKVSYTDGRSFPSSVGSFTIEEDL